jgi:aldehyde:ferredoxin oxidoreductase
MFVLAFSRPGTSKEGKEGTMKVFGVQRYTPAKVERGYTDRILRIDLSSHTISIEEVPEEMRRRLVGGRGYCLQLVFDGTNAQTRFDSPENVLALAGGPFCGETAWVGTGKFIGGTISPLTQSFCDSNVGGHFFPLVKLSGFDAIAVTGRSTSKVMVLIDGDRGEVSIREAPSQHASLLQIDGLLDEWKGEGQIRNVAILTTGKGAGNVYFGCLNSIYFDPTRKRSRAKQAGRGGTGTVMQAKGLWGIVVRNNRPKSVSNLPVDLERLRRAGNLLRGVIREVDPKALRMARQGTTSLIEMMNAANILPINNFQFNQSDQAVRISGDVFEKDYFEQGLPDGCFPGCTLACTKGCDTHVLRTGPYAGRKVPVDGPEYETAAAVTNLGIFDPEFIMDYAWYCDEYGVDTISAGVTMAFLFEAYEQGYLTDEETGGLALRWGDTEAVSALLHAMAEGKGFGAEAGRGIRYLKRWIASRAAARTGRETDAILREVSKFGMECKGLEFSMYGTKESLAQQGGYGFALKGAQHDEAWLIALDQIHKEMPSFEQKARALKWFPLFRTWFNLAGLCKLPWIDVRHPEAKFTDEPAKNMPTVKHYLELVNATLGGQKTLEDLLHDSEVAYTLHKLFNLRHGFGTREDDAIPLRAMAPVHMSEFLARKDHYETFLRESAGMDIQGKKDEEKLAMLQQYRRLQYEKLCDAVYEEKGYDRDGIPRKSTLMRLGFHESRYVSIVDEARERVRKQAASKEMGRKLAN